MSLAVVTDSSVYMSDALAAELGVRRVPLSITLGGETMPEPSVEPKAFYTRLRVAGKAIKVAQVAAMRKLLLILNAMVRDNRRWDPATVVESPKTP